MSFLADTRLTASASQSIQQFDKSNPIVLILHQLAKNYEQTTHTELIHHENYIYNSLLLQFIILLSITAAVIYDLQTWLIWKSLGKKMTIYRNFGAQNLKFLRSHKLCTTSSWEKFFSGLQQDEKRKTFNSLLQCFSMALKQQSNIGYTYNFQV